MSGLPPAPGVGARISGSTPAGGHKAPLDLANLPLKGSLACPVVVPGSVFGRGSTGFVIDAQSSTEVVAVGCGGVVTDGGAWANTPETGTISPKIRRSACFTI